MSRHKNYRRQFSNGTQGTHGANNSHANGASALAEPPRNGAAKEAELIRLLVGVDVGLPPESVEIDETNGQVHADGLSEIGADFSVEDRSTGVSGESDPKADNCNGHVESPSITEADDEAPGFRQSPPTLVITHIFTKLAHVIDVSRMTFS